MNPIVVAAVLAFGAPQPSLMHLPKNYICYRATSPMVIDGRLNEDAWRDAPWTDDFVDIEGDVKPKPTFRTRARMLWDDHYLYIGAQLEEPHVWATLTEHDCVIYHDNDFEVFIDPDGDNHNYYEIELNAFGTEWDLRLPIPYRDGGNALNSWEIPGLKLATHIDGTINDPSDIDRGWSVELAIPWNVLGEYANRPAPPRDGDQWRINFSRVEWEIDIVDGQYKKVPNVPEHNWVWSPQGVIDMHQPERWGFLQFSTQPPGQADYRLDPSWAVQDWLMQAYHAQIAYRDRTGRYAASLDALALPPVPKMVAGVPVLKAVGAGWEIQVDCHVHHHVEH